MTIAVPHGTVSGYRYHRCKCAACRSAHAAKCNEYRRANPEKVRGYNADYSKRRHGLSPDEYQAMLASQGGRCAICKSSEPRGQGVFHIDHDHACCPGPRSCGECIRGLLCASCNGSLGGFRDDPELLRQAIQYLNRKA